MYRKDIKNANGLIVAEETKSRFSRLNMYIFQTDNIVQILTSCLLYWVINTRGFSYSNLPNNRVGPNNCVG